MVDLELLKYVRLAEGASFFSQPNLSGTCLSFQSIYNLILRYLSFFLAPFFVVSPSPHRVLLRHLRCSSMSFSLGRLLK